MVLRPCPMVGTADRSEVGMYRDRVVGEASRRVPVDSAEMKLRVWLAVLGTLSFS